MLLICQLDKRFQGFFIEKSLASDLWFVISSNFLKCFTAYTLSFENRIFGLCVTERCRTLGENSADFESASSGIREKISLKFGQMRIRVGVKAFLRSLKNFAQSEMIDIFRGSNVSN